MQSVLRLQKCLYFNLYLFLIWSLAIPSFLFYKIHVLDTQTKYQSVTVYILVTLIEILRLYCGQSGNSKYKVPEIAGFLMLSILMQLPLLSFFLFNPNLLSTPTEIVLHGLLWSLTIVEIFTGFIVLRKLSSIAKSLYFSSIRQQSTQ